MFCRVTTLVGLFGVCPPSNSRSLATKLMALGFVRQLYDDMARVPGFPTTSTPISAAVCNVRDGANVCV